MMSSAYTLFDRRNRCESRISKILSSIVNISDHSGYSLERNSISFIKLDDHAETLQRDSILFSSNRTGQ